MNVGARTMFLACSNTRNGKLKKWGREDLNPDLLVSP